MPSRWWEPRPDRAAGRETGLPDALEHARHVGLLHRVRDAQQLWYDVYPALSDGRPGLLGSMTGRAEAQVMRLACVYAWRTDRTDHGRPLARPWRSGATASTRRGSSLASRWGTGSQMTSCWSSGPLVPSGSRAPRSAAYLAEIAPIIRRGTCSLGLLVWCDVTAPVPVVRSNAGSSCRRSRTNELNEVSPVPWGLFVYFVCAEDTMSKAKRRKRKPEPTR